jgi:hypothetical protein
MFTCSVGEEILTPFDDVHQQQIEIEQELLILEERCQNFETEILHSKGLMRSLKMYYEKKIELLSSERDRLGTWADSNHSNLSTVEQKHLEKLQDRSDEILKGLRRSVFEKNDRIAILTTKVKDLRNAREMVVNRLSLLSNFPRLRPLIVSKPLCNQKRSLQSSSAMIMNHFSSPSPHLSRKINRFSFRSTPSHLFPA